MKPHHAARMALARMQPMILAPLPPPCDQRSLGISLGQALAMLDQVLQLGGDGGGVVALDGHRLLDAEV